MGIGERVEPLETVSDPLVWLLEDWAKWMRGGEVAKGYPKRSSGFSADARIHSFEDLEEQLDSQSWRTITTVINDLIEPLKRAIWVEYLHCTYWDCAEQGARLTLAHATLREVLPRKGVAI